MAVGGALTSLPCKHKFHLDCVQSYMVKLKKENTNPICPECNVFFMPLKSHMVKVLNENNQNIVKENGLSHQAINTKP